MKGEESVEHIVGDDLIRQVFEEEIGFLLVHVEPPATGDARPSKRPSRLRCPPGPPGWC